MGYRQGLPGAVGVVVACALAWELVRGDHARERSSALGLLRCLQTGVSSGEGDKLVADERGELFATLGTAQQEPSCLLYFKYTLLWAVCKKTLLHMPLEAWHQDTCCDYN